MRLLLLALLAFRCLGQEPAIWIDVSGDWRLQRGDDLRYAAPEFDDSRWNTLRMPHHDRVPYQTIFWVRKSVALPAQAAKRQLWLTVGTLRSYEIYVNGRLVANAGSVHSQENTPIPQPRTFPLPAEAIGTGERLQIAIRANMHLFPTFFWLFRDEGPWLLTSDGKNAAAAADYARAERWIRQSPRLVFSTLFLVLAVLTALSGHADRSRRERLWLSLYFVVMAWLGFSSLLRWTTESRPFLWNGVAAEQIVLSQLGSALFAHFVMIALGFQARWIAWTIWLGFLAAPGGVLLAAEPGRFYIFAGSWCAAAAVVLLLAEAVQRGWRGLSGEELSFRLAALIHPMMSLWYRAGDRLGVPAGPRFVSAGSWLIFWQDAAVLLLSLILFVVLLRRVVRDRSEQLRLTSELEAARGVQQLLLKKPALDEPDLRMEVVYLPAQEVGGDFYCVLDGRCVVIGDVSGKGLRAAMLVSLILGVLRGTAERRPAALLGVLNRALAEQPDAGFVTCCCIRFEPGGSATIANAGHPSPWLNNSELSVAAGLPLGIDPDADYEEARFGCPAGSCLTLVSDGVIEATNSKGELFGFDRTAAIAGQPAKEIAALAQAWGQNDDITVVTVCRGQ